MKLYLVQHGEAYTKEENPERPLTEKGKNDSLKTAVFLKKAGTRLDYIWHSSKKRAIETAEIFKEKISPSKGTEQKDNLAPNDAVKPILADIEKLKADVMLVGHMPFLQKISSLALVGDETKQIVKFEQGGVVVLQKPADEAWQVVLEVIPSSL